MKIIDKINEVQSAGGTVVSFEFFPAKVVYTKAHMPAARSCVALPHATRSCFACVPPDGTALRLHTRLQTDVGVDNLLKRIERMTFKLQPTFVTLTWRSAFKVWRHFTGLANTVAVS